MSRLRCVSCLYSKHVDAHGDVLQLAIGREGLPRKRTTNQRARAFSALASAVAKLHPIVQDVVQRRADGRSLASEPLGAFAERLAVLGYAPFRMWWQQTVAELRLLDAATTPVASAVLAASLVEGALTFVVRHAHTLGVLGSKTFDDPPQKWKIEDLVSSACAGRATAILDAGARHRADALIRVRQRIHAGRMLSEYPGGVPDLRPEEARDARSTADLVVRRILDWLDRYPATTGP
jgi:hypothetical protein